VGRRLGIVFAGPFFNFLFAVVAFAVAFVVGLPSLLPEVGEVKPDFPAYQAGLQPGDRILEVNGSPVKRWEDLAKVIHESGDRPLHLKVEREQKAFSVSVTPRSPARRIFSGMTCRLG